MPLSKRSWGVREIEGSKKNCEEKPYLVDEEEEHETEEEEEEGERNEGMEHGRSNGSSVGTLESSMVASMGVWSAESGSKGGRGYGNGSEEDLEQMREEGDVIEIEKSSTPGILYPPELLLEIMRLYLALVQVSKEITLREFADCRLVSSGWKPLAEEVLFKYLVVEDLEHWTKIRRCLDIHPELFLLITECEILCRWPNITNKFEECIDIVSRMPNLRKLSIHHLDYDHPARFSKFFPNITEFSVIGMLSRRYFSDYAVFYGEDEDSLKRFKRPASFIAIAPFFQSFPIISERLTDALSSLELHDFEFVFQSQELPVALTRIILRKCIDDGNVIDRVFRRSRSTVRHFAVFNLEWTGAPKFPTFIDSQTPWKQLVLVSNPRYHPSYIPKVKTLCCTLTDIITSTKNLGNSSLDEVQRVILTSEGHNPNSGGFAQWPSWDSLRWLELDIFRFDDENDRDLFFDIFGAGVLSNVRVLCLHSYHDIPKELPDVFPNVQALLLNNIHGRGVSFRPSKPSGGEVSWLQPSLRIISMQKFNNFDSGIHACFMDGFVSGLCSNLRMIVLPTGRHRRSPAWFLEECERRGIDITEESVCFEGWARSIIK